MNARKISSLHLPRAVWGIAAILASGVALASVVLSNHGAIEAQGAGSLSTVVAPAAGAYRCPECGVIESTREIGVSNLGGGSGERVAVGETPNRNYEITIRRHDGTMSVIRDAKSAKWRHGELVTLIAGAD